MIKAKTSNRSKKRSQRHVDEVPEFKDGREFDALSADDKEKVWNYYDRKIPLCETRDPTPAERARMKRIQKDAGRSRIGEGAKLVAVTIEKGLLQRADEYAKGKGMKRAELIARGLLLAMGESPT